MRTHRAPQTFLHLILSPSISYSSVFLPYAAVTVFVTANVNAIAFRFAKFVVPLSVVPLEAGNGILESPCLLENLFSISLPATSRLGGPISCGKFVFPSHYLPLPILDVPSPVVNPSSHPTTCYFPSWTFLFSWKSKNSCQL